MKTMSDQPYRANAGAKYTISTVYPTGRMGLASFYLPKEMKDQLRKVARARRVSSAMVVREALEAWFQKAAAE